MNAARIQRQRGFLSHRVVLAALLAVLLGCDSATKQEPQISWLESAVVADLTQINDEQPSGEKLTTIKAIGFDTVMVDVKGLTDETLETWLATASAHALKIAALITPPPDEPGFRRENWQEPLLDADALIITISTGADITTAQQLRARLRDVGSDTALIAHLSDSRKASLTDLLGTSNTPLFDALLTDQIPSSENTNAPSIEDWLADVSQKPSKSTPTTETLALPHWRRLSHCDESAAPFCSEDIRLLISGFMQPITPVTAPLDEPYWQDIYRSLIAIRTEHPWIRSGTMDWYSSDSSTGAVAYRITNEDRAHLLVALNISDQHLELPLPFGFMADSKIKLWTSYDPILKELVTSKPVSLPARSAVIVIKE